MTDQTPLIADGALPFDFVPKTAEDWQRALRDPMWRICSGQLYKIITKGDDGLENAVQPFIPNINQLSFLRSTTSRAVILKARQLGFTTLICIVWLDHALFVPDQRCLLIAHKLDDAKRIFRDKILFAYQNLPAPLREVMPLAKQDAAELMFKHNGSGIAVSTSARSGTYNRLHVSEMGKIAAYHPGKATEIVTGSFPAVPKSGWAFIESTAEGTSGEFYDIANRAELRQKQGLPDVNGIWAFRFYAWHNDPGYEIDPAGVYISPEMHEYFDLVERQMDVSLSLRKRAWYINKRDNEFAGDPEKMWQEMPSTPAECWQKSNQGTFFGPQVARARAEGRISRVPFVSGAPVNTFWDIGAGDGTAIWLHQHIGATHRFVAFEEAWSEGYDYFVRALDAHGCVWGEHYLPHDGNHEKQGAFTVASPLSMLRKLRPSWRWRIVPRVLDLQHGINVTRAKFQECYFDEEKCAAGIHHLENYRKRFDRVIGAFTDDPVKHDGNSEAADAFRQFAQGYRNPDSLPAAEQMARSRPTQRRRAVSGLTA